MRLPIKNCVVEPHYRATAYSFIEKSGTGRAARPTCICPMVEESEGVDGVTNVTDYEPAAAGSAAGGYHTSAYAPRQDEAQGKK